MVVKIAISFIEAQKMVAALDWLIREVLFPENSIGRHLAKIFGIDSIGGFPVPKTALPAHQHGVERSAETMQIGNQGHFRVSDFELRLIGPFQKGPECLACLLGYRGRAFKRNR